MKHYLLIAALLLAARPAFSQQVPTEPTALDVKNGFRGYKFGSLMSEHPTLEKRGKHYVDNMELRQIGNIELDGIEFYFDQDKRLNRVKFSAGSTQQPAPLFTKLVAEYGPPQVSSDTKWVWPGQRVTMTVKQYTLTANVGYVGIPLKSTVVYIETNEALAQREAAEKEKGPKLMGTGL